VYWWNFRTVKSPFLVCQKVIFQSTVKTTFTTLLTAEDGTTFTIHVTRKSVACSNQDFAVTGQSAQGKTLPNVLNRLHEGGFGAYVAASRAVIRKAFA